MSFVLCSFLADETGETMIEYGLIAALASITIITSASFMGSSLDNFFNFVSSTLNSVVTQGG